MSITGQQKPPTVIATDALGKRRMTVAPATVRRTVPTSDNVQDPATLARMLGEMQTEIGDATKPERARHDRGYVVIRDVAFGAGTAVQIAHGLGAAWGSWSLERVRGGPPNITETAPSATLPAATYLVLTSAAACTADVKVWR